jgi:putative transposase
MMDPSPERKALHHAPPPWVRPGELFFITICCAERGRNQLAQDEAWTVIRNAVANYHLRGKFWARLVLAMPDHLHALLAFPSGVQMDRVLRDWKRYVAKEAGISWRDGFFDHRVRAEENLEQKAEYIRMNPGRAGLAADPATRRFACRASDIQPAR